MQFFFCCQLNFLHCFHSLLPLIRCLLVCFHAVLLDDFICTHSKFFSSSSFFHYGPYLLVHSNQSKVFPSSETSFCLQLPSSYSCSEHQGHEISGTEGILTVLASGCPFLWLRSQSTSVPPVYNMSWKLCNHQAQCIR